MTVLVNLLIGDETWELQKRSLRSIRNLHPDLNIVLYYSLSGDRTDILKALDGLQVEGVDIGAPGLLSMASSGEYSNYNTHLFNIRSSFKWLAMLGAMTSHLGNIIFVDADILLMRALPLSEFDEIWEHYEVFVQDEGTSLFPKHPCTGFVGMKFGEKNITLLDKLHKEQAAAILASESQHDQSIFFQHISRDIDTYKQVYFLPQNLFPVGYLAPIYRNFDSSRVFIQGQEDPILYHANWTVGIENKAALMDAFGAATGRQEGEGE
jgi:hypothetical protein